MKKSPEKETEKSKACDNYVKCKEKDVFNSFSPAGIAKVHVVHIDNPQII